jgi:alpha-tubulin suppressor-like RCC1 family protein
VICNLLLCELPACTGAHTFRNDATRHAGQRLNQSFPLQTSAPKKVVLWDEHGSVRVVAVAGAGQELMAIDEHGAMWACGRNLCGQLGFTHNHSVFNMQRVPMAFLRACDALISVCIDACWRLTQ